MQAKSPPSRIPVWAGVAVLLVLGGGGVWYRSRSPQQVTLAPDPPPAADAPAFFAEITQDAGLSGFHQVGRHGAYFFPDIMAPGGGFFDFDRDGDLDLLLVNSAPEPDGAAGLRLFRQDAPQRFVDVTDGASLESRGYGMGLAVGDVNNDGFPDVYITNYGGDQLFLNQRDGTFLDVSEAAGIDNRQWGASACLVDYDRDGWLDVMVTNYVDHAPSKRCEDGRGKADYCGPQVFFGTSDRLYQNETASRAPPDANAVLVPSFVDVSVPSGIATQQGPGLGVVAGDFNDDRWPDVYVANDGTANFLWINQQDGTFADHALLRGVAYDNLGRGQAGMGIAIGDVNGDAAFDLFVTHLDGEINALYMTDGVAFREVSRARGLADPSFRRTGFGTAMADFDHDGDLDIVLVNGRVKRGKSDSQSPAADDESAFDEQFAEWYAEPNQLFLNEEGMFTEYHSRRDPFLSAVEVSRGLATGDIDNHGDLDLLVTNSGGPARLYRNDCAKSGHWLMVDAIDGRHGGRTAEGAVVIVTAKERQWRRLVQTGSSYLSTSDPRVHFGLGAVETVDRIEVVWPDGVLEAFEGGPVDRLLVVRRGEGAAP